MKYWERSQEIENFSEAIYLDIIHAVEEPSFDGVVTRKPLAEGIALRPHPDDAKVLNLHDPQ